MNYFPLLCLKNKVAIETNNCLHPSSILRYRRNSSSSLEIGAVHLMPSPWPPTNQRILTWNSKDKACAFSAVMSQVSSCIHFFTMVVLTPSFLAKRWASYPCADIWLRKRPPNVCGNFLSFGFFDICSFIAQFAKTFVSGIRVKRQTIVNIGHVKNFARNPSCNASQLP